MTTKKLSTDQKVDLVLEKLSVLDGKVTTLDTKVTKLDEKVTLLQNNQNDLIKTVSEMAIVIGKTADRLEAHIQQSNHQDNSKSFTPFTSGAFVA
ncbi:MAG: hypothetical protein WCG44_03325 [bacterium]